MAPTARRRVLSAERHLLLSPQQLARIQADPELRARAIAITADFREFARLWRFRDPDTNQVISLSDPWQGQELLIDAMDAHAFLDILKSRKLGFTTLETAWDGFILMTRPNSRVHGYSTQDDAAQDILKRVGFGLGQMPEWLRPPITRTTSHVLEIGGGDDLRVMQVYATGAHAVAVEQRATHSDVDEWSKMLDPAQVFQDIEPTFAPSGTAHILMTSKGRGHPTSKFFEKALAGDAGEFHAFFASAELAPDRDPAFFEQKIRTLGPDRAAREYPRSIAEALSAGGAQVFPSEDLAAATDDPLGPTPPQDGFSYVMGVDIGRIEDPTVITILRVGGKDDPVEVVHCERLRNRTAERQRKRIQELHGAYGCLVVVEDNYGGWAIREDLEIPDEAKLPFTTTNQSKPRIIENLQSMLRDRTLRWAPEAWPELHREMQLYEEDDDALIQDHVMSLAIAAAHIRQARGRRPKKKRAYIPRIIEI
jgi:hypothetical protein